MRLTAETIAGFLFSFAIGALLGAFAGGASGFTNACRQAGAVETSDGRCLPRDIALKIEGLRKTEKLLEEQARENSSEGLK